MLIFQGVIVPDIYILLVDQFLLIPVYYLHVHGINYLNVNIVKNP